MGTLARNGLREMKELFIKYNQDFLKLEQKVDNTKGTSVDDRFSILTIPQVLITLTLWV